jgi:hypothetical protein
MFLIAGGKLKNTMNDHGDNILNTIRAITTR